MRNLFKLKNQESQRGVAAVEFAIVLPLLLFLFIGITEFGIAYYNKQIITNASREGARASIRADAEVNDIKEIVRNYIIFEENGQKKSRLITFGTNAFLDDEDYKDQITISVPDTNSYRSVSVEFNYTYLLLAGFNFFGADFDQNLTIGASTVMKMEPIIPE
jgi:hypothetical protein